MFVSQSSQFALQNDSSRVEDAADAPKVSADDSAPPNGGLRAWLQVLGSFFLFFNTWYFGLYMTVYVLLGISLILNRGIINSYGVFQTYYEQSLLQGTDASTISWIGSLQSFLIMFLGVLTGPIYDAGHTVPLLYIGSFLVVLGHMMLSLCDTVWQVLLAQSICVGIGAGLLFVPSIAILSAYFTTKLPFAVGIAACGSSVGGVIYPILIRDLISRLGFAWSVRIAGFLALFGLTISCLVMRVRTLPATRRKLVDCTSFRDIPYLLFNIGLFLCFMGLYTPYYYVQSIASQNHTVSTDLVFYLLPIINASSTLGRLVPGYLSQIMGSFNIIVPCSVISGALILCLLAVHSQGALLAFCVLYGCFSGSLVSLLGPVLVFLSPHVGVIGTRMGMCFTILSIALLVGTPISGAILDASGANPTWIYSGCLTLAGGIILGIARMTKTSWRAFVKV